MLMQVKKETEQEQAHIIQAIKLLNQLAILFDLEDANQDIKIIFLKLLLGSHFPIYIEKCVEMLISSSSNISLRSFDKISSFKWSSVCYVN